MTSHLKLSKNKKKMSGAGCAFIAIKSEIRTFSKRHNELSSGEKPIPYPVSSPLLLSRLHVVLVLHRKAAENHGVQNRLSVFTKNLKSSNIQIC